MKLIHLSFFIALSAFMVACGPAQVKDDTGTDGQAATATQDGQQDGATASGMQDGTTGQGTALGMEDNVSYEKGAINDPNSVLSKKIIYFAYDSDQISEEDAELLKHHGKYLANNPDVKVTIEGHADERGSREYNIALGNRRAQAARRLILFQGVNTDQIEVVSYGEEKPVALGHDEQAWSLNRRVELVY